MGAEYEAERGELIKVALKALKQWDGAGKEADEVDDGRIVLSVPGMAGVELESQPISTHGVMPRDLL